MNDDAHMRHPQWQDGSSAFSQLRLQPADALLPLIKAFRDDPRPGKLDLGVGVYRDHTGATPVFAAVKAAERLLVEEQVTKAYLGPEGDLGFLELLSSAIFGIGAAGADITGVQTPGGTGALRLAAELANAARPGGRIWLGLPSWPIHRQIFEAAGLHVAGYRYFDALTQSITFDEMLSALRGAGRGDLVLLHGCSHNPTGADLVPAQVAALVEVMSSRQLVPLIDLAYQGLGRGWEADAHTLHTVFDAVDEAIVAYSCDKNFGLYRERTGAFFVRSRQHGELVRSNVLSIARCLWSMPPDHGAAVVRIILQSPELRLSWEAELRTMRLRLESLRGSLANTAPGLERLHEQSGLFALLPLSTAQVEAMRRDSAVYMASSGRINLAGLTLDALPVFARALMAVQFAPDRAIASAVEGDR